MTNFLVSYNCRFGGQRRCKQRQAVGYISAKGVEPMRITFHIGEFTFTIIVKKRKNRHPAR